mmetsp:Transcript_3789/g.8442  ORF Transcript_3789/g.8442 Transcript_3789/m.8442 type:complete len:206 (-) Transcript_3789:116-733(-)
MGGGSSKKKGAVLWTIGNNVGSKWWMMMVEEFDSSHWWFIGCCIICCIMAAIIVVDCVHGISPFNSSSVSSSIVRRLCHGFIRSSSSSSNSATIMLRRLLHHLQCIQAILQIFHILSHLIVRIDQGFHHIIWSGFVAAAIRHVLIFRSKCGMSMLILLDGLLIMDTCTAISIWRHAVVHVGLTRCACSEYAMEAHLDWGSCFYWY